MALAPSPSRDAAVAVFESLRSAREEFKSTVHSWKRGAGVGLLLTRDSQGELRAATDLELFENFNLPFEQQFQLFEDLKNLRKEFDALQQRLTKTLSPLLVPTKKELVHRVISR
jgi:hypothetical protein